MTRENRGRRSDNTIDVDYSVGKRSGRPNSSWRYRTTQEKESRSSPNGPYSVVDIGSVEGLRKAIAGSNRRRSWGDWLIILGSFLLALCVIATLVLASGINARANRLIENDAIRVREGGAVVVRLEGKLNDHIGDTQENGRKLDIVLMNTATTTTTIKPRTTTNTTTRKVVASTTVPTTKVERSTTSLPPTTFAPATTLPPCRFALLNICLSR